jgi:hypothetical protein
LNAFFNQNKKTLSSGLNSDWQLIDDFHWNHDNLKLGLIDGQDYTNLNLDLDQFSTIRENKKKQLDLNNISSDCLNESIISINEAVLNYQDAETNKNVMNSNIFSESYTNFFKRDNLDSLKIKLMNNYWEFDTR